MKEGFSGKRIFQIELNFLRFAHTKHEIPFEVLDCDASYRLLAERIDNAMRYGNPLSMIRTTMKGEWDYPTWEAEQSFRLTISRAAETNWWKHCQHLFNPVPRDKWSQYILSLRSQSSYVRCRRSKTFPRCEKEEEEEEKNYTNEMQCISLEDKQASERAWMKLRQMRIAVPWRLTLTLCLLLWLLQRECIYGCSAKF